MQSLKRIFLGAISSSIIGIILFSIAAPVVLAANNLSDTQIGQAISHYNDAKTKTPSSVGYADFQRYLKSTEKIISDGAAAVARVSNICKDVPTARLNQLTTDITDAVERHAAFTYEVNRLKDLATVNTSDFSEFGGIGTPSGAESMAPYIEAAQNQAEVAAGVAKQYEAGCLRDIGDIAGAEALEQGAKGNFIQAKGAGIGLTPVATQVAACKSGGTGFIDSGYYCMLTGLGGFFPNNEINIRAGTAPYLDTLYKIGVSVATGLALIFITIGGVQYASTDSFMGASEGKKRIWNALFGLVVVLSSWIMLNAINPELLKNNLSLDAIDKPLGTVVGGAPSEVAAQAPTGQSETPGDFGSGTIHNKIDPNAYVPEGTPFTPRLTAYSPQAGGDDTPGSGGEGSYASARKGLDGVAVVRTLDDVFENRSGYVTLAGDPTQYGKTYIIPSITYSNYMGEKRTLTNVVGYVHDTGSAFDGDDISHFDVAVGRDYGDSLVRNQPYSGSNTPIVGATPK